MINKGQKINDRYEIMKLLGEGGMANVYLAYDIILERKVAVKILRGDLANDEKFVRRFQREALAASSLSHPNIVEMYDVGESDGNFYIVMEYIEGKNLKQLIKKRGALTVSEVVDIMNQLTDGLAHAHDLYIIHRDIKPQNILILDNGLVKITDFGIAMALNSSQLTQTNSIMGSVHYLPPEQASGRGCTIKSDVYSLGILMYELLTGKLPFKGENAVEIALKHMKDPLPGIIKDNSNISQSIENIIIKATAKNPRNRYHDAREMYNDLRTSLDEERKEEKRYVYKHLEHDLEDTRIIPPIIDSKEETIAKPITSDEYKPNKKLFIILSSILAGLIVIFLAIFFIIPALTKTPNVKIPDVSKMTLKKAESKLLALGFEIDLDIEEESSDTIAKNRIIKTKPAIGRYVKKGTIITLFISTGPDYFEIENYVGQDIIEVKTSLLLKGIDVAEEKKTVDDVSLYIGKENIIIAQSVKAGTKLKKGDDLVLYLPDIYDLYPDMVAEGWTLNEVEDFALQYNLALTVEYQVNEDLSPFTVISQSRNPNSKIIKGASIKVIIAKAKEPDKEIDKENDDDIEEEL